MTTDLERRLDLLDAELLKLLKELEVHSDDLLNQQPPGGGWSALQVMQHLMRSEMLSRKYLEKKLSFQPELKKAGIVTGLRGWMLNFYLRAPFKFKAPDNVDENSFPIRADLSELADQWLEERRTLRRFLEQQPAELFEKEVYRHPFAGRLSLAGMVHFFDGHFRRHREQIRRTLAEIIH